MELKQVNIKQIKIYENNPRIHEGLIDSLTDAIRLYGFRVPILMREDGTLIDGHGRLKAAKRLGMSVVPALIFSAGEALSEEMENAFRISINELAQKADWDQTKLMEELEKLQVNFNLDEVAQLTGFDLDLIEDLLAEDEEENIEKPAAVSIQQYTNDIQFPTTGRFDFPKLLEGPFYMGPTPEAWLGDDDAKTYHLYTFSSDSAKGLPWNRAVIGFYTADGKFERVWRNTAGFVTKLKEKPAAGVITPDFSVFPNDPLPLRLMAAYQSLYVGRYLQEAKIPIIVNVSTCEKDVEAFLESLPHHAPLSRQIQASMNKAEIEAEIKILEEIAKFQPQYLWIYAPTKFYSRFDKQLKRINNVHYITPRLWARREKYGF